MEYPEINDSSKPDPNCPDCEGTGKITLFNFDSPCNCTKRRKNEDTLDDTVEYNGWW